MPKPGPHTIGGFLPRAGLSILLAVVAALAGCQAPAEPSGPTELVLRIPDYERFVDASLSVLRQYDLPPSRVDRPRGLIVSQPTTSAQWFECWRGDTPGGYQSLEASLHTTRRVVTIQIKPLDTPPPGFVGAFAPAEVPDLTEWPESAEATAPPAPPEPAAAAGAPRDHVQCRWTSCGTALRSGRSRRGRVRWPSPARRRRMSRACAARGAIAQSGCPSAATRCSKRFCCRGSPAPGRTSPSPIDAPRAAIEIPFPSGGALNCNPARLNPPVARLAETGGVCCTPIDRCTPPAPGGACAAGSGPCRAWPRWRRGRPPWGTATRMRTARSRRPRTDTGAVAPP